MKTTDFDKACRAFCESAIDAELLMDIEKISRYKGEYISLENVYVKNLGSVRRTEWHDKIDIKWGNSEDLSDFSISIDTETKEKQLVNYDLTLICDTSVCSKFDLFVLVSERPVYKTLKRQERKLWVYLVKENNEYYQGVKLPTITKLKNDIRKGGYTPYRSLIYEFCDVYSLARPIDECDKMATLYTLISDINLLKVEAPELFNTKVYERWPNNHEAREKEHDKQHKKALEKLEKKRAKLLQK